MIKQQILPWKAWHSLVVGNGIMYDISLSKSLYTSEICNRDFAKVNHMHKNWDACSEFVRSATSRCDFFLFDYKPETNTGYEFKLSYCNFKALVGEILIHIYGWNLYRYCGFL